MATVINQNYSFGSYSSLKAIPISGTVTIEILDSSGKVIGSTKTNSKGEWLQSFSLEDGLYEITYKGNFYPIGQDQSSRYLVSTNIVKIPINIVTPISKQSLSDLKEIVAGNPIKNSVLYGNGSNWTATPITDILVDLVSEQNISGQKSYINKSIFFDGIVISSGKDISFGSVGRIYNDENGVYFQSNTKNIPFNSIPLALSELSDVYSVSPSINDILVWNGSSWGNVNPDIAGVVTTSSVQNITGIKSFLSGLSLSTTTKIFDYNGEMKFSDPSGEYLLSELGKNSLADLSDVSDGTPTEGNILLAIDNKWASVSPLDENFMMLNVVQTVTALKTFSDGLISNTITSIDLVLTQTTGTAPISVASTTVCTNLNADKWDGQDYPLLALGDLLYGGASGVASVLAGNITSTKKFLTQTGTGAVSAIPAWNTISIGDVGGLLSGSSPITFNSGTGAIGFDFSTTNSWSGTNSFTNTTTAITIGAGAAATDYSILFDGQSSDGYLYWMEDEAALNLRTGGSTYFDYGGNETSSLTINDVVTNTNVVRSGMSAWITASADQSTSGYISGFLGGYYDSGSSAVGVKNVFGAQGYNFFTATNVRTVENVIGVLGTTEFGVGLNLTITNLTGGAFQASMLGSATITNSYGVHILAPSVTPSTKNYGLLIDAIAKSIYLTNSKSARGGMYFGTDNDYIDSSTTSHLDFHANTNIDFNIGATGGTEQLTLVDGKLAPTTDNDIDLGDTTHYYKNAYIYNLYTSGGFFSKITVVTDTYAILATDQTVVCNKATAFTVTLPTAVVGQAFNVKNIGAGVVTLEGNGADTIDGELNQTINQWETIAVICYVANSWVII